MALFQAISIYGHEPHDWDPNVPGDLKKIKKFFEEKLAKKFRAFLLTKDIRGGISEAVFWLLAPPVTAAGFTVGIVLFDHIAKASEPRFSSTFLWSLIGCVFGAAGVYWFGPMLIVFGMFVAGTASIIIMEAVKFTHRQRD